MMMVVVVVITTTTIKGIKVSGNNTRKALNKFSIKTAVLGTSHVISATIWNLKPGWWGVPLVLSNGYQELFPWGVKRPGREADHSLPSSAEVKE
jgi:hypothetical protein